MAKADRTRQVEVLSIEQENAIDLLRTGKSDAEVGAACGVARQTVSQWRNHHTGFIAELNRRRAALWESDIDTLRALVGRAVAVLAADLEGDDIKARRAAAVHILRAVGIYGADGSPKGHTSESEINRDNLFSFF